MKRKSIISLITSTIIAFSQISLCVAAEDFVPFKDIPANSDMEYINTLKRLEIVEGFENNIFKVAQTLTRAEAAKMFLNINRYPAKLDDYSEAENPFSDVTKDHWAFDAIVWAKGQNIINGFEDGTFKPDEKVTEEQLVKMAVCACGYDNIAKIEGYPDGYIRRARALNLYDIDRPGIGSQAATRFMPATLLYNMLQVPPLVIVGYSYNAVNGTLEPDFKEKPFGILDNLDLCLIKAKYSKDTDGNISITPTEIIYQVEHQETITTEESVTRSIYPNMKVDQATQVTLKYDNLLDGFKEGDELTMYLRYNYDDHSLSLAHCE